VEADLPAIRAADVHAGGGNEPDRGRLAVALVGDLENVQIQRPDARPGVPDLDPPGADGRLGPTGRLVVVLRRRLQRVPWW